MAVNVHANSGLPITDPLNTWSPYGPQHTLHRVVLQYYDSDTAEFAAFQGGTATGLDVGDSGAAGTGPPASDWPSYDANSDWNMSAVQGSADWQGMYFNGASSTWAAWGCDWKYYNSACGREMRQAFAHLINRPDFDNSFFGGSGGGNAIWDDVPANKVLSSAFTPSTPCPTLPVGTTACTFSSPNGNFCGWDTVSNAGCTATTGPYLAGGIGSTSNGFPVVPSGPVTGCPTGNLSPAAWSSCNNDFALAAEHMVLAGVASGMDSSTYQVGNFLTHPSGIAAHPFRDCVRTTNPRRTFGDGWDGALNLLFGTGGVIASPKVTALLHGNIVVCGFDRAFTEASSAVDDWDSYTYGYSASGPFADYMFTQFSTKFTYQGIDGVGQGPNWCGVGSGLDPAASNVDQPTNPTFTCLDGRTGAGITTTYNADTPLKNAVSTTNDETTFDHLMALDSGSALDVLGKVVASLPVHTLNVRVPALRTVNGLTDTKGLGYGAIGGVSFAHFNPAFTPSDPKFAFDGGLSTDTLRWGQASGITYVNPYNAATVWEFQTLGWVYDALFLANPVRPQQIYAEMAQTYSTATVGGNTAVTVELRQNLRFQDGTPVTARDVAFSLLTLRDESTVISGALGLFDHVTLSATDPLSLTITMTGQSVGHLINISAVPILPLARWACPSNGKSVVDGTTPCNPAFYTTTKGLQGSPTGTTIPDVDPLKGGPASAAYDPIVDNNFIGSGLLMCTNGAVVGGGCSSSGSQETNGGDSIVLEVFNRVNPPLHPGLKINDPFAQYMHTDDPNWSTYATVPGATAVAESGQQQEFQWAQGGTCTVSQGCNTQRVSLHDLTETNTNCYLQSGVTASCPDYAYWNRANLHPAAPGTISAEADVVTAHYLDTGVGPFQWTGQDVTGFGSGTLTNIISFPGNCAANGSNCPP